MFFIKLPSSEPHLSVLTQDSLQSSLLCLCLLLLLLIENASVCSSSSRVPSAYDASKLPLENSNLDWKVKLHAIHHQRYCDDIVYCSNSIYRLWEASTLWPPRWLSYMKYYPSSYILMISATLAIWTICTKCCNSSSLESNRQCLHWLL